MSPLEPALAITGLTFQYEVSARDGDAWRIGLPSFHLALGEQCLLTAASGRGKSTLLSLIAGLIDPHGGAVEVAGTNIHSLRGRKRDLFRGRHIGMIFQTFNLLQGFTALENVKAALMLAGHAPKVQQEKASALLTHLGITRPNATVETLSVGQQQRVAVARAVACDPVLVLADEPTASLDPESSAAAMDLIQNLCREKNAALLCVSHDPAMSGRFQRREALGTSAPAAAGAAMGGAR